MSNTRAAYTYENFDIDRGNSKKRMEDRKKHRKSSMQSQEKKTIVTAILIVGLILIGMVILSAVSAQIKHANNELISANNELQDNIDMLNIKIQSTANIGTVEKIAKDKLGMVYPEAGQYVYINGQKAPDADFASVIKKQAYN